MSMVNPSKIELLTMDNYDTWRMQIEAVLIKGDLWEYVSGPAACRRQLNDRNCGIASAVVEVRPKGAIGLDIGYPSVGASASSFEIFARGVAQARVDLCVQRTGEEGNAAQATYFAALSGRRRRKRSYEQVL